MSTRGGVRRARHLIHRDCLLGEDRKSSPPRRARKPLTRCVVSAASERSHPPTFFSLQLQHDALSSRRRVRTSTLHLRIGITMVTPPRGPPPRAVIAPAD